MDRVRRAGARARRQRPGGDRTRYPHSADADRGGRARCDVRAGEFDFRPDRLQPERRLHLGELFDRNRRRVYSSGVRRGAFAVSRARGRKARLQGDRTFDRGRKIPARGQGYRPRLLVDRKRRGARSPRERDRADQAAVNLSRRRQKHSAHRSAGEDRGRGVHPRYRRRECAARARAAAALARRAAGCIRRCRRAQGREGAD